MMRISILTVIGALTLFIISGCTHRLTDFTIISTKNVDLSRGADFKRSLQRVEGNDTAYTILFFPTGIPNVKEAVDRAIEGTPGAVALLDGVVESEAAWFILGGYNTFRVKGTPLVDPKLINK